MMKAKSNKLSIMTIIAVASLSMAQYCDSVIIPCLNAIYETFDMSAFFQAFIVTGTTLIAVPISLILGKVMGKVRKKPLLIGFLILYTVSGALLSIANTTTAFLVFRTLSGMCISPIMLISTSLVLQLFRDDERLNSVLGFYNGLGYIYSAIVSAIAGVICVTSWRGAQLLNLVGIVPLLLTVFMIPDVPADEEAAQEDQGENLASNATTDKKMIALSMIEGFFGLALMPVFMYFVDMYITERAIGDSAMSGTLSSACTLCSAVGAIVLFGILKPRLKQYTGAVALMFVASASILLGFDIPVWAVYVVACIEGLGLGVVVCFYPAAINECVSVDKMSLWQGVYNVVSSVGFFVCGYAPFIFMGILKGGYQQSMMAAGVVLFISNIITVLIRRLFAKNAR